MHNQQAERTLYGGVVPEQRKIVENDPAASIEFTSQKVRLGPPEFGLARVCVSREMPELSEPVLEGISKRSEPAPDALISVTTPARFTAIP